MVVVVVVIVELMEVVVLVVAIVLMVGVVVVVEGRHGNCVFGFRKHNLNPETVPQLPVFT